MTRRTDRADPSQASVNLGDGIARHGMVSGRPIERIRAGWFLPIGDCDRAHWLDPITINRVPAMRRLCDGIAIVPGDLLEPGTWPSCRRCRTIIRGASS
jgi:hypothetical protein